MTYLYMNSFSSSQVCVMASLECEYLKPRVEPTCTAKWPSGSLWTFSLTFFFGLSLIESCIPLNRDSRANSPQPIFI